MTDVHGSAAIETRRAPLPTIVEGRRALRDEMDRAVLDAYGWSDVAVPRYRPVGDEGKRAMGPFGPKVIDRLFALNARRAEKERLTGVGEDVEKKVANGADANLIFSAQPPALDSPARRAVTDYTAGRSLTSDWPSRDACGGTLDNPASDAHPSRTVYISVRWTGPQRWLLPLARRTLGAIQAYGEATE